MFARMFFCWDDLNKQKIQNDYPHKSYDGVVKLVIKISRMSGGAELWAGGSIQGRDTVTHLHVPPSQSVCVSQAGVRA